MTQGTGRGSWVGRVPPRRNLAGILLLAIPLLTTPLSLEAHAPRGAIPLVVEELALLLQLLHEGKGSEVLSRIQGREEIRQAAAQLDRTANLRLAKALASRQRDRDAAALRRDLRMLGFHLMLQPLRQIEQDLTPGEGKREPLQALLQQGRNVFILLFEAYVEEQDPPLHRQLEVILDLMEQRIAEGDPSGYSRLLKEFVEAVADAYNIPLPR